MPITILSPHSGKPVKIRDQDVGRAVRDEEKRIFYALPRPDGEGHYAALTRNGSPKDLERYDALEVKIDAAATHVKQVAAVAHDARGPGRSGGGLRLAVILALLGAVAAGGWLGYRAITTDGELLPDSAPALPLPDLPGELLPSPTPPAPLGWNAPPAGWRIVAASNPSGAAAVGAPGPRLARARDYAVVRYELARLDGRVIDATNPLRPLGFVLWSGTTFRGLDATVAGMRVGDIRSVELPAAEVDATLARGAAERYRLTVELIDILAGVEKTTLREGEGEGQGPAAAPGDQLTLEWTVRLEGRPEPIVSTDSTGGPATLTLGAGDLIEGLEQGLAGMRPGETAEFRVPPHLAYGEVGCAGGLIPAGATVLIQATLLAVEPGR